MTKEYAIRPYMSDLPYAEQVRLFTDKAVGDLHPVKHSEFKQPYLWPSYPEMEYWWDWPPWITIRYPGADFPWLTQYQPNIRKLEMPCDIIFNADLSEMCWCKGETMCFYVTVFHPIIAVELEHPEWHQADFAVSGIGNMICITASAEPSGIPGINVWMRAMCEGRPITGSYDGYDVPECWPPDDKCCAGANYNPPEWDTAESIETIDQDDTGIIAIIPDEYDNVYGLQPYTWSVSGTGFSLLHPKTSGKTNVLIASETACGMAEITVIDRCGNECAGIVGCSAGGWSNLLFYNGEMVDGIMVSTKPFAPAQDFPCDAEPFYRWDVPRFPQDNPEELVIFQEKICDCSDAYDVTETDNQCISWWQTSDFYIQNNNIYGCVPADNPCNQSSEFYFSALCDPGCGEFLPDDYAECMEWWPPDGVVNETALIDVGKRKWEC